MAGERIKLEVMERDSRGSAEARRLRRGGLVPGILYGRGKPPHACCVHQGVLSQVSREVRVEALPMEVPEHLELDVSDMGVGDTMRLSDLPPIEGVTYLDDPEETVLANVTVPTEIVEPEPEEEEELEEGEV